MANNPTDQSTTSDLEESLMGEIEEDARMTSGAHSPTQDTDLDFINMTGLVAPIAASPPAPEPEGIAIDYDESDLNPEAPVSFYEKGVDDVDTSMDPENTSLLDDEIITTSAAPAQTPATSTALAGLQDIITELSQEEPSGIPEPATEFEVPSDSQSDQRAAEPSTETASVIENLTTINLEAASIALEELNLVEESDDLEDLDVSDLIASIDFGEAEALLEELESQIPDGPYASDVIVTDETPEIEIFMEPESAVSERPTPTPAPIFREPEIAGEPESTAIAPIDFSKITPDHPGDLDASVYSKAPLPKSAPRHKRRRSFEANVLFFSISFLFMVGAVGFLYFTLQQYTTTTLTPEESYATGITLINDGLYQDASMHFTDFSRRYANDPLKSDAEFMSAYALQLTPSEPHSVAMQAYNGALIQFESFVTSNPTHEKTARAQTLIGVLNYKIGNYSKAIYILSDPKLRLRDSSGYLPALRILARSYAALLNVEDARLTFMRAGNLDSNIAPEKDYIELASMYSTLGDNASDQTLRSYYMQQSIELWEKSMRLPGILPAKKKELEILRDYTRDELSNMGYSSVLKTPSTQPGRQLESPRNTTDLDLDSLRLPDSP